MSLAATDAGVVFAEYHDRIYRYLLRMVKNAAEAEDLTQETFLRAYRRRDSLRHPEAVRGWLYRIATHACLDRVRQRRASVSLEECAGEVEARGASVPSALKTRERKETSACVQRCLDFLPDHYRAAILLHEAHGLTAPEIAELLGISVGAVKIRLHRARGMLQKVMECGCAVSSDERGLPVCEPKQ